MRVVIVRAMDLGRFGHPVRELRVRRRWRQQDLADAASLARSQVGRIERGERRGLTVDALDRVATALGATADPSLRWRGEGLDRLLDEGHARLVEVVVRRLRALGWDVAVEVSFSSYGERGSIDVLAFRAEARALLVVEVKSVAPDMQSTLMGVDRKGRLGPSIARERGWDPAVTGRLLVLWDTRTNRRRIEARDATVRAALPARGRDVQRWLADPGPPGLCGIWFVPNAQGQDATGIRVQRVRRLRARVPREVPPDS